MAINRILIVEDDESLRQVLLIQLKKEGYEAIRHQEFVGTGYFDEVTQVATGGLSSILSMDGSTEQEQFKKK